MSEFRNDPADTEPQRGLQGISTTILVFVVGIIVFAMFAGCRMPESKYASWDAKCENAFAHDRDIRECKALARNDAVLVAE